MPRQQRTIGHAVELSGVGLFSGNEVSMRLLPAETSTGYLFVRTDLPDDPVIPATTEALGAGMQSTTLSWNEVEVKVVEHLLSACAGLHVDNLIIEVDGDEMPALGGCAAGYAEALREAGIVDQGAERPSLKLARPVTVSEGDSTIVALPDEEGLTLNYVLDLGDDYNTTQSFTVTVTPETFMSELAPARTFGREEDRQWFIDQSIGGGIDDANTFVLRKDGSAVQPRSGEPAELLFPDEAARHKAADLLGDMALAGVDLAARVVAIRSGHELNAVFAQRLSQLIEGEARAEEFLDVREIRRVLPHRYPFLMVDRVLRIEGENKIVTLKNVSVNEEFFQGHYPDYPIMPGVLQIEAMAQTAGLLFLRKLAHTGKVALVVSMDGVKLRRPVVPGDQLILEAETVRFRPRLAVVKARGTVNGQVACQADMTFMLADADSI